MRWLPGNNIRQYIDTNHLSYNYTITLSLPLSNPPTLNPMSSLFAFRNTQLQACVQQSCQKTRSSTQFWDLPLMP